MACRLRRARYTGVVARNRLTGSAGPIPGRRAHVVSGLALPVSACARRRRAGIGATRRSARPCTAWTRGGLHCRAAWRGHLVLAAVATVTAQWAPGSRGLAREQFLRETDGSTGMGREHAKIRRQAPSAKRQAPGPGPVFPLTRRPVFRTIRAGERWRRSRSSVCAERLQHERPLPPWPAHGPVKGASLDADSHKRRSFSAPMDDPD